MSRQRRIPTPSWERDRGITGGLSGTRIQVLAAGLAALLVVAALAAVGFGFLYDYLQDRNRPNTTALRVGDTEFTVRDFTNRAKMYITELGGSTQAQLIIPGTSGFLTEQAILLKYAGEKEVSATDDEVKAKIAELLGIDVADANFDQRFQEELTKTGLSEDQYRDYARYKVLKKKMDEKFKAELPPTAESVHYRQIVVADQTIADDIKAQVEAGGDFAALAAQHSTDTTTKDKGGDKGWTAKGVLPESQDSLLFSLDVNQVVTSASGNSVVVYQVVEKDPAHPLDDASKPTLATANYRKWLDEKKKSVTVKDEMDFSNGNSEKIRYVIEHAGLTLSNQ